MCDATWVFEASPHRLEGIIWHLQKLFWHTGVSVASVAAWLDILSCLYPPTLNMQSNRSPSRWNGIQLTLISSTCMMWRLLIVWMCDEGAGTAPGNWSVMKHSRRVARGVYSTPCCKMKLWKSNLHSGRPIAFITTDASMHQRLYFNKISITSGFFDSCTI